MKEIEKKVSLENSANSILLKIGDESKKLSPEIVMDMNNHLSKWLKMYDHYIHYAKMYKNFSIKTVKEDLDRQEKEFEFNDDYYRIGENYATFIIHINDKVTDNNKASDVIRKDFKKEFPKYAKYLEFDPEHSFCYIYIKNREVAEKFIIWAYEKYIRDVLKEFNV